MISHQQLEVGGALVIAVVSVAVVAVMAWNLLRPSRVPERLPVWEWKTPAYEYGSGHQADLYAAALGLSGVTDVRVVAGFTRPREAFQWPARGPLPDLHGPVRENFRHWLEGGPDYCG